MSALTCGGVLWCQLRQSNLADERQATHFVPAGTVASLCIALSLTDERAFFHIGFIGCTVEVTTASARNTGRSIILMIVMKFGGTSVGGADAFAQVARIVALSS
jgi:hypothetical protein